MRVAFWHKNIGIEYCQECMELYDTEEFMIDDVHRVVSNHFISFHLNHVAYGSS